MHMNWEQDLSTATAKLHAVWSETDKVRAQMGQIAHPSAPKPPLSLRALEDLAPGLA